MIDSHCHLDGPKFASDFPAVLDRARAAGVTRILAVGSGDGPPDLEAGIRLAESDPIFVASVGVHPHEAAKAGEATIPHLIALTAHPRVVAVGEIGLDYHYDFSPRETQRDLFARQMEVARDARLPILIHTREAWDDTFNLIEKHWDSHLGGVFHCFSGGPSEAERALALGFHLGIGGVVTFPRAEELRAAVAAAPADRLLLETDAPYLAPVPYRGKRNEPAFVVETARRVAEVRGVSVEEIDRQTTANFERLFRVG